MLLFSAVLAPVLYHLWVYAGSGNANFFYASTLAFNLAQVGLYSILLAVGFLLISIPVQDKLIGQDHT